MCGIIGIFGRHDAGKCAKIAMESILHRGKDGIGYTDGDSLIVDANLENLDSLDSKSVLVHNLHSIVGDVLQPLQGKEGFLAINCEIYGWEKLAKDNGIECRNDAELVLQLIEKHGVDRLEKVLAMLDGVFSLAYWKRPEDKVYVARDIIGVKPMWYSTDGGLSIASERKALHSIGKKRALELNPRKILVYDITEDKMTRLERGFFRITDATSSDMMKDTENLLIESIKKRVEGLKSGKIGLLFSGGIDSVFIAHVLKEMGIGFTCYTAALDEKGMSKAADLDAAEDVAKRMGYDLRVKKISLNEVAGYIGKVAPLIEENNVVKIGVGVTMFAACEEAKKDGVRVILSGLGSEEIFAGYERHKDSSDINKECLSGLLKIYERDLYRDDVIAMYNGMEMRLPFLDKRLVEHSLSIPTSFKINGERNKIILRDISAKIGIPEDISERKKRAAQYGSKIDRAIQRLAGRKGLDRKSDYLKQFYTPPNLKLGVLWSGGKDSAFAAWIMMQQNYEISCLISIDSRNEDSYMFHTPNMEMTGMHSQASGIPLIAQTTEGVKEEELDDLRKALSAAKEKHDIDGVVTGALFSNYQRDRVYEICDDLELKIFSPLWHMEQKSEMERILKDGFEISIVKIAAYGLESSWLGETITHDSLKRLVDLSKKNGMNVAGEGGEFESLVLDAPFFNKKIVIDETEKHMDTEDSGVLNVKKAHLEEKRSL